MLTTKWFTLGAAAALFIAAPALAADGHADGSGAMHGQMHGGSNAEAMHGAMNDSAKHAPSYGKQAKGRKVEVTVTKKGFEPASIPAKKGEVLNLVVTRKVEKTCATDLVQKEQGVYAPLPLDKPVTVTLVAPQDGQLRFTCAYGHLGSNIVVQ